MTQWDKGRAAARRGEPKENNPFNHPDRQKARNEFKASWWDEGWEIGREEFLKLIADLPVKHIGMISALCDRRKRANLREDLGGDRYRRLGLKERFTGEAKYYICPACIKYVETWPRPVRRKNARLPQLERLALHKEKP